MKEIIIKVYKYSELPEEGQSKLKSDQLHYAVNDCLDGIPGTNPIRKHLINPREQFGEEGMYDIRIMDMVDQEEFSAWMDNKYGENYLINGDTYMP